MFGCFFAFSYHFIDPMRWRLFIGVNHVCSPLYMGDFCDTLILQPQPQGVHIVPEVDDFLIKLIALNEFTWRGTDKETFAEAVSVVV